MNACVIVQRTISNAIQAGVFLAIMSATVSHTVPIYRTTGTAST